MSILDSVRPMGKLVFSAVESGTGGLMGMGGTKALHSLLGSSLAFFSYLQGLGVHSNETKESKLEGKEIQQIQLSENEKPAQDVIIDIETEGKIEPKLSLGEKIMERAHRIGLQDVEDLGKAALTCIGAGVPMFLMDYMGGTYMQEEIAKSFNLAPPSNLAALTALPGVVISTVADGVIGMAMLKTLQSVTSVALASTSYMQGKAIASNEAKEKAQDKIGEGLEKRALRTLATDVMDIAKAIGVLAVGTTMLYVGNLMGGQSIQVSALTAFRSWKPGRTG